MNLLVLSLLVIFATVAADKRPSYKRPRVDSDSDESSGSDEAPYNFNWVVKDDSGSSEFGHEVAHDGEETKGSYFVHLPDGRLQRVTFYVDGDSGYHADVTYEGEASFPDSDESRESEESREKSREKSRKKKRYG